MKLDPYFTLYTKINTKQIKDLNLRHETIKLLEYTGRKLHDIGLGSDFSGRDTKSTNNKSKNRQVGLYIKLKSFCTVKERINKVKITYRMGKDICKPYI